MSHTCNSPLSQFLVMQINIGLTQTSLQGLHEMNYCSWYKVTTTIKLDLHSTVNQQRAVHLKGKWAVVQIVVKFSTVIQ